MLLKTMQCRKENKLMWKTVYFNIYYSSVLTIYKISTRCQTELILCGEDKRQLHFDYVSYDGREIDRRQMCK